MRSILAQTQLFCSLTDEELARVESLGILRNIAKGSILFYENDVVECMYVLLEGRLKLYSSNDSGREFVYHVAEPGISFGELALFCDERRSICAEAETDCVVMSIHKTDFMSLLLTTPELKDQMLNSAMKIIFSLTNMVRDFALKDVYGRIRVLFERLAQPTDEGLLIDEQMSQQDIADRVGASREMIAKIMRELVAGGYVETGRKRLMILKKLPEQF
ncbi:Crp/Fnr family transcriptional regulator [Deefgea salmonis]|uniref:Crp/Fnr family transcriptional regulator n=1 Tax=Deefgea salmonis TaxID=2875502 RepID=A0ABS8BJL3_9NEIS|nr:Crp/Fnr family transcriptional regulator [Deefgea salmonis]MCB5195794.1 Crp/Fnr family transcriptional regulator [Deefgea salmonis]